MAAACARDALKPVELDYGGSSLDSAASAHTPSPTQHSLEETTPGSSAVAHGAAARYEQPSLTWCFTRSRAPLYSGGQGDVYLGTMRGMPVILKAYNNEKHMTVERAADTAVAASLAPRTRQVFVPTHCTHQFPTLVSGHTGESADGGSAADSTDAPPPGDSGAWCTTKELCLMDMHDLLEPAWDAATDVAHLSQDVVLRRLFRDVVCGVAHMHAHGIAHNDLKLCNVFVGTQDTCRVDCADSILAGDTQPNVSVAEVCLAAARTRADVHPSSPPPPAPTHPHTSVDTLEAVQCVFHGVRARVKANVKQHLDLARALHGSVFPENARLVARVGDLGAAQAAPPGHMPIRQTLRPVCRGFSAPELFARIAQHKAGAVETAPPSRTVLDEMSMDVFALGVMVYTAVTGTQPFEMADPTTPLFRAFMCALHGSAARTAHPCMRPDLPEWTHTPTSTHVGVLMSMTPECRRFIRACTHPDPARRVHSAMLVHMPFLTGRGVSR